MYTKPHLQDQSDIIKVLKLVLVLLMSYIAVNLNKKL